MQETKPGCEPRSVRTGILGFLHYPAQPSSQIKDANPDLSGNYILPALTDVL